MNSVVILSIIYFGLLCSDRSLAQELPTKRQVILAREIAAEIVQKANDRIAAMSPTSAIICHSGFAPGERYRIENYSVQWTKLGPEALLARFQHEGGGSELLGACDFFVVFDRASPDGRCYDRVWTARPKAEQCVAPQSATRSESDSEGDEKPQPESEGRSR